MPSEKTKALIEKGRNFIRFDEVDDTEFEPTDQQKKLPQPPLVKAKMSEVQIDLPIDYHGLKFNNNILKILHDRESHRVYTEEKMTLMELGYLLWATQGIKSIRGNNYATLRTVPSGGARHEFETYLAIRNIDGIALGMYHYLPMTHQIELISEPDNMEERLTDALSGQAWAAKANVVFIWTVVPYRSEWRYTHFAHRIILVDIGHVCQNLYIACESIGLGTCAIGAFERRKCDTLIGLETDEEFTILASPVGTVSPSDKAKEQDFYSFLKREE